MKDKNEDNEKITIEAIIDDYIETLINLYWRIPIKFYMLSVNQTMRGTEWSKI